MPMPFCVCPVCADYWMPVEIAVKISGATNTTQCADCATGINKTFILKKTSCGEEFSCMSPCYITPPGLEHYFDPATYLATGPCCRWFYVLDPDPDVCNALVQLEIIAVAGDDGTYAICFAIYVDMFVPYYFSSAAAWNTYSSKPSCTAANIVFTHHYSCASSTLPSCGLGGITVTLNPTP